MGARVARLIACALLLGCAEEAAGTDKAETAPVAPAPEQREAEIEREGRVVFDFVANRVLGHRFVGNTWVAQVKAGHFDKLIPFATGGWAFEERAGLEVGVIEGGATLRPPERALRLAPDRVRLFATTTRPAVVDFESNGKKVARIELAEGWADVEAPLTGPLGETIRLKASPRGAVGVAAVALGRGEIEPIAFDEPKKPLEIAAGESMSFYVTAVSGATLDGKASGDGCELEANGNPLPVRFEKTEVTRVDVSIGGCDGGAVAELAIVGEPALAFKPTGGAPENILFWVMDTLRADRIRPINPDARAEVPGFERLAKRGVTFRRAWVEGNESKASHASMWTSVYPAVHNIRSAGRPGEWQIGKQFLTMGELMRAAGKEPIALTANGMVTRKAGYGRGFKRFENPMRDGTGKRRNGWIPADRLYKRAIELLEPQREPFFFFFGTIDTHKPWVGHQPWLDRYDPGYKGKFRRAAYPGQLGMKQGSMQCTVVPKARDLQRINAIYDSAISYQDQHLGKMLDWLEARGALEDTLIIVTADHGEELWEVGRCGHGASLREVLVNVPLFMSFPKRLPSGVVVEEGVDGVDVLPTILELLDVELPRAFQGASLVRLARAGGAGYPRASYASQYEYAHAMRIGDWKLRVGKGAELYNLAADPEEMNNLIGESPVAEQQLTDALFLFLRHRATWKKWKWGVANNLTREGALALESR